MERVVAVLLEVQRQVELRYVLGLQGPRLGMLDLAHSGILGHPAAEGVFPCPAKRSGACRCLHGAGTAPNRTCGPRL